MAAFQPRFLSAPDGTIGRRLTIFMALGFVALIGAVAAAAWMTAQVRSHTEWVIHTYRVENAILETRRLIEQGETTRRGYLLAPDDQRFLSAYRDTAAALPGRMRDLATLTHDNPRQRALNAGLRREVTALARTRETSMAQVAAGDAPAALATFRGEVSSRRLRRIRDVFDAMNAEERRLLTIRDAQLSDNVRLFYLALGAAAILLALVAAIALLTVLAYTRDLARSRETLERLNGNLEGIVATRTADLTRANDEIQRFAYIVSHDLRSPLVNVMGFTAELDASATAMRELIDRAEAEAPQLVSDEMRFAAREDLPEAIGFIRTSTQKMDRLINAILQLSRQGRRVLSPEPIDIPAMVGTIRETLAHRLDEKDAELIAEEPLPVIVSDRFSLDQALSNLIDNAVKYLRPGVPGRIVVRGRREGSRAIVEVADNGRGIDPRDHQRVFDLFRRSGAQDTRGEGIGLATVRALVFRLGGTIDVQSTLGEGSTFRLSLPLTLEPQDRPE